MPWSKTRVEAKCGSKALSPAGLFQVNARPGTPTSSGNMTQSARVLMALVAAAILTATSAGAAEAPDVAAGRAIAQRFSKEGASVLVVDRDTVHGPETVELVRAAGGKAEFVSADTSDFDTGRNIMLAAEKHFGGVDILVSLSCTVQFFILLLRFVVVVVEELSSLTSPTL